MAVGFPTKANWAAGDILTAAQMDDLAGTVNTLSPVGQANGSTLVANSANASGLGWTSGNPIPNPVLNSAFQVAQRGTSFPSSAITSIAASNTLDRWGTLRNGLVAGATFSRQNTNDTTNLPNIQYCLRAARDNGNTNTAGLQVQQSMESINSIPFAGKSVTLSFYARAGANFSSAANALGVVLYTGTGTDQNPYNSYTGQATPINQTVTLTTTWQRFSITGTIATTATEMALNFQYTPTGTAGAADYFEMTGVQIDVGSVALPFRTNGTTLQGELSACQRYYYRAQGGTAYSYYGIGSSTSTSVAYIIVPMSVQMRTYPSSTIEWANLGITDMVNYQLALSGLVLQNGNPNQIVLTATTAASQTQYRPAFLSNQNNTAGYLGFSAEL